MSYSTLHVGEYECGWPTRVQMHIYDDLIILNYLYIAIFLEHFKLFLAEVYSNVLYIHTL